MKQQNWFRILEYKAVEMAEESCIFGGKVLHTFIAGHVQQSLYLVRHKQSKIGDFIEFLRFVSAARSLIVYSKYSCLTCLLEFNGFPYQGSKINEWFVQEFCSEARQEQKVVNVINVNQEGRTMYSYRTQGQAENFPDCLLADDYEVFFHGSNHRSVQDIIERGIDLSKGKEAQDFSDGDGYYVGISFDEAFDWARSNTSPSEGQAVLIYRVHKEQLRGENNDNGLNLREDKQEWLQVVREYRHYPRDRKPNRKLRKDHKKRYAFIEGPRASVSRRNPSPSEDINTYQLCVRNDNCAQLFNNSVHSVVFFKD